MTLTYLTSTNIFSPFIKLIYYVICDRNCHFREFSLESSVLNLHMIVGGIPMGNILNDFVFYTIWSNTKSFFRFYDHLSVLFMYLLVHCCILLCSIVPIKNFSLSECPKFEHQLAFSFSSAFTSHVPESSTPQSSPTNQ